MPEAAIIGAGKTGRGFLARLLSEEPRGYDSLVLIDKDEALVRRLNERGRFAVRFFGNGREPMTVSSYRAFAWGDEGLAGALRGCEAVFVSVGGQNLPDVGRRLAPLLKGSAVRAILTAENAAHPAKTLGAFTGEDIPVAEGTVFCTTVEDGDLNIASENYPYFQCDGDALQGYQPLSDRVRPVPAFGNFLTRKLYTYNAASCVIAYLGFAAGYTDYADAANDPEILRQLDKNYEATNRALCREYGYDPDDQREFALLSRRKFLDRTIADTVLRNGRDPRRKLAPGERILGPMALLIKYGEDASVLERTAAAALRFREGGDSAWDALCREKTPEELLQEVCGLEKQDEAFGKILSAWREMETKTARS